ncbi:sensor histidine kinase [Nocardiopsis halophila]|uniref:sensor histidine kinase n=1 Tax=Nocardiopsis halophila TaxID=141692 RepID=UPI00034620CC|nr:histidine kinase [Nocardiopsis halophila]
MKTADDQGFQRMATATRWSLPIPLWSVIAVFGWGVATDPGLPAPAAIALVLAYTVLAGCATVATVLSLDRPPSFRRRPYATAAIAAAAFAGLAAVPYAAAAGLLTGLNTVTAVALAVLPMAAVTATAPPPAVTVLAAACAVPAALHPSPGPAVAAALATWALSLLFVRLFEGSLRVIHRLDTARLVESRLAVAEERLRFARDLHDTLGRTLSVIALKSELGARLCETPQARAEMEEVQRLARASQEEIREVVRGYRRSELLSELEGARALLKAAGIVCRVDAACPDGLTDEQGSALGWVVREGVTNVVRHSRATYCTIALEAAPDAATLRLTNNGARTVEPDRSGGGLDGLRQRVATASGTLAWERTGAGLFTLTARLPRSPEPQ